MCELATSESSAWDVVAHFQGQSVEVPQAIGEAGRLLAAARAPLVFGMSQSGVQTVREAIHLAETLRATIDPWSSPFSGACRRAFQSRGIPTCTLGELRDRADLVIFWGGDPAASHPCLLRRFVDSRPVVSGRNVVSCLAAEVGTASQDRVNHFVPLEQEDHLPTLRWLRREFQSSGKSRDFKHPGCEAGASRLKTLLELSRATVICFDFSFALPPLAQLLCEELIQLAGALNAGRRCSLIPLGGQRTAETVLCWQTGYAVAVNFRHGTPESDEARWNAEQLLATGKVDAAVLIGDDWRNLGDAARQRLQRIPVILLNEGDPASEIPLAVRFEWPVGACGCEGTRYRLDGVPIRGQRPAGGQVSPGQVLESIRKNSADRRR